MAVYTKEDQLYDGSYYFAVACLIVTGLLTPYVMYQTKDKTTVSANGRYVNILLFIILFIQNDYWSDYICFYKYVVNVGNGLYALNVSFNFTKNKCCINGKISLIDSVTIKYIHLTNKNLLTIYLFLHIIWIKYVF